MMAERSVQLVLHYDGTRFAGWQRQPDARTVQAEIEQILSRLCNVKTRAVGAGRTDAGVHARGQAVGALVPDPWTASKLRRALNALLPDDIWVAAVHEMQPDFHARYSALSRAYSYRIGTDDEAHSPFRSRWEWPVKQVLDRQRLDDAAQSLIGDHCFRAYAVRGTAPARDEHRCVVREARWRERRGGLSFEITANRFLHHMVRFLVGTMVEVAAGRRDADSIVTLLDAPDNSNVSPPAPAHALCLEQVEYPRELYRTAAELDDAGTMTG
jgi:tRNA pseudouridine38-40 synthase